MNEIVIDIDEPTTFRVFFEKDTKLWGIILEQNKLRIFISGLTRDELKQLNKRISKELKNEVIK